MDRVEILDTTLRDGAQGEGVSFSVEDKLKIIRLLDDAGVDYIEAGNPASSMADRELFTYARDRLRLRRSRLVAFGSTVRPRLSPQDDPGLATLISCGTEYVSIVGKAVKSQTVSVLGVTPDQNLAMIRDTVSYLTRMGLNVFFDAEHFFDGFLEDPDYALEALSVACDAGAAALILCDTNGGGLPTQIFRAVREAARRVPGVLGIHCHNDSGLATACTLSAVEAGCSHAQGAVNGYGERCGNANLCEVLPNLVLKMGRECLEAGSLPALTGLSRSVGEIANISVPAKMPYVGRSAFAHKAGMHIDAMRKDHSAFEHVDPAWVGNTRRYLMSGAGGRGALSAKLSGLFPQLTKDNPQTALLVEKIKTLEDDGYAFEDADASLTIRAMDFLGLRRHYFEVLDFHVVSRKPEDDKDAQAYVKVRVGDRVEITADEGDGPVNALDLALRKALTRFYPSLEHTRLTDFKVRVVGGQGTAARVRVHIESTDGERTWSTVGVSANLIEASFIALTDSIEYMLWAGQGGASHTQTKTEMEPWAKS